MEYPIFMYNIFSFCQGNFMVVMVSWMFCCIETLGSNSRYWFLQASRKNKFFFSLEFFLTSVSVTVWLREKLSPSPTKQLKLKHRFSLNISQDPLRFLDGCYKFFMFVFNRLIWHLQDSDRWNMNYREIHHSLILFGCVIYFLVTVVMTIVLITGGQVDT